VRTRTTIAGIGDRTGIRNLDLSNVSWQRLLTKFCAKKKVSVVSCGVYTLHLSVTGEHETYSELYRDQGINIHTKGTGMALSIPRAAQIKEGILI